MIGCLPPQRPSAIGSRQPCCAPQSGTGSSGTTKIVEVGQHKVIAHWHDGEGRDWSKEFTTAREATDHLVKYAHGGLRFHDLRHSYATWLVSAGVPINDVSAVMGHEQTSTTLDRYTHPLQDRDQRVRSVFADFLLTPAPELDPETEQEPTDEDS